MRLRLSRGIKILVLALSIGLFTPSCIYVKKKERVEEHDHD